MLQGANVEIIAVLKDATAVNFLWKYKVDNDLSPFFVLTTISQLSRAGQKPGAIACCK